MEPGDIDAGLRFCRASGWNQLESDWRCFLGASPAGCRVALAAGEVAGTVATLRFDARFSWISMLLVAPELRGRGIGTALLMEALRVLEDVPCVRLDATPAGKKVYDQYGFRDEYPLVRMRAERVTLAAAGGTRRMTDGDFAAVLQLDPNSSARTASSSWSTCATTHRNTRSSQSRRVPSPDTCSDVTASGRTS